jgi:hypothetical protein
MKKFNLVIVALLVLSVSVFAVDVTPSASVSGEASVTFTYDLDASTLDIANAASASLSVDLIASTSVMEGEGDVVGHIEISGIALQLAGIDEGSGTGVVQTNGDGDSLSVSAMIYLMGPALYIDITNLGASTDFASAPDFNDDYTLTETVAGVSSDAAPTGSVSLVYTADAFNVTVTVGDDDAAAGNGFDFGLALGVTAVDGLDLSAGVSYDASGALGYGVSVGYSLDIASVSVGFDGNDAGDMEVAASVGVDVGATVDVTFGTDLTNSDLIVAVSSGSLVDVVSLGATFELANFADFGLEVTASADVAPLSPYATFSMYPNIMGLTVGTGIAVIENVDLDVNYSTADLGNVNGAVEFSATIAY